MTLQFDVSLLSQEEIGAVHEHWVDCRMLIGDQPSHGRVIGDVTLLRTMDGILATASLTGSENQQCSRCLEDIQVKLELRVQEEFIATVDAVSGAQLVPPDDPDAFRISGNQILDMEEAARQAWISARPIQALCNPDCSGLCPECGRNLNQSSCSCTPAPDERWGRLRELAQEMKGT
ncbi:MAG: DUF177 domain-containing protein [Chloroflexi bacterium]|nr:DUF177 domain-containing protein [Chloroflexota bacterium]